MIETVAVTDDWTWVCEHEGLDVPSTRLSRFDQTKGSCVFTCPDCGTQWILWQYGLGKWATAFPTGAIIQNGQQASLLHSHFVGRFVDSDETTTAGTGSGTYLDEPESEEMQALRVKWMLEENK